MSNSDSLISAEIVATCGTIGYKSKEKYVKDPDCSESLKDLILFLKNDDESHEIRRQLAKIKVLQTDLLPLMKSYPNDKTLFDINIRLLINLTSPALLLYHEELPEEKVTRNYYLEILSQLQEYKQAFTDPQIWKVLSTRLCGLLQLDWEHRQEEDRLIIERILILVRNVLHVPADPSREKRTDDDVSIHDQILWALHSSGIDDLIIYLASSNEEQQFCFHILEILFLLLREQVPQQLATAGKERFLVEKQKDEQELLLIREQEAERKKASVKLQTARHSRFGGTFEIKNIKSISDRDMIYHQKLKNVENLSFNQEKEVKRKPKNKRPMQHSELNRRSTLSIRLFLRDFCAEFLNSAYNPFMAFIKNYLMGNRAQDHDETYYLWAMQFFMEFSRLYSLSMSLVTETMSVRSFHYVQTQLEIYYEMMLTDKKKIHQWSKRMHSSLKTYQELLLTLAVMNESHDSGLTESARIIKSNIFYVVEYRDLLLTLLMNYDEIKFSQVYLKDLVETAHIFLKLLEKFCKKQSHVIIQQKKVHKKNKRKKNKTAAVETRNMTEDAQVLWDELSSDLSSGLQRNDILNDVVPFDAASDHTIDQQRIDVIANIKEALQQKNIEQAISLLRAAREVWPEDDVFGSPSITPDNEFLLLREIYLSNVQSSVSELNQPEEDDGDDDKEDSEGEEEVRVQVTEREFNISEFIAKFACTKVVRTYSILFANYQKNSTYTNHCVLKMLHRISCDRNMAGLLFQASVFRTFQKILNGSMADPITKELARFAKHVMRKFFEVVPLNKKIFVEILFWKNVREAYEVQEGYGTYDKKHDGAKQLWSEEEEYELQHLYEEYKDVQVDDGKDLVDHILEHMLDQTKTRRMVIRQLRKQSLITDIKQIYKSKIIKLKKDWSEEEIVQLVQLYKKYKDATDILSHIEDNLSVKRPKYRIIDKLLELKLVQDRKQLRKKKKTVVDYSQNCNSNMRVATQRNLSDEESLDENNDPITETIKSDVPISKMSLADERKQSKDILKTIIHSGFVAGLKWLKESLEDAKEDRENGDTESIPLVPILSEHYSAMENNQFLKFMRSLGLAPPASEQESFWRIPSFLKLSKIDIDLKLLEKALENEISDSEEDENSTFINVASNEDMRMEEKSHSKNDQTFENLTDDETREEANASSSHNLNQSLNTSEIKEIETDSDEEIPRKRIKRMIVESDED